MYRLLHLVAFILAAIFLALVREKATKRPQKVAQSSFVIVPNIMLCSLDVNISSVRTTALDKGQERHAPLETSRS